MFILNFFFSTYPIEFEVAGSQLVISSQTCKILQQPLVKAHILF